MFRNVNARSAPTTVASAEMKLKNSARVFDIPLWTRTAKSPSSCGISWAAIAIVVAIPVGTDSMKLAAMIMPSRKLWSESPRRLRWATGWMQSLHSPW